MSDEPVESKAVTYREVPLLTTKDHGAEMSMAEFGEWMTANLGTSITKALEQAAFMLCCDVISQDVGKSTLRLRERTGAKTSRVVDPGDHAIATMLALEPNRRHTWTEYTEMVVYWGCLTSNSYSVVLRDRVADPLELIPVQSGRVREKVEGRDVFYDVTASTQQEMALLGRAFMTVPERDMVHVRGRMLDGLNGYSTLVAGKKTLDVGANIDNYRDNLFGEDGALRGVFTRKDVAPLDDLAFDRFRSQLRQMMSKFRKLTEPIVLEGDFDFKAIASKPTDVELTAQFAAQINATCRLMRVPPHKVFQMDGVKYENLETSELMYLGDTLVPVCKRHEERLAKVLLSREDRTKFFFEYDRDEMTLRDPARETDRVIKAVERSVFTIDEARARLGQNELPHGQGKTRLVPTNMSVVDESGKVLIGGVSTPNSNVSSSSSSDTTEAKKDRPVQLRVVGEDD